MNNTADMETAGANLRHSLFTATVSGQDPRPGVNLQERRDQFRNSSDDGGDQSSPSPSLSPSSSPTPTPAPTAAVAASPVSTSPQSNQQPLPYTVTVLDVPESGAKSRVETQIKFRLQITRTSDGMVAARTFRTLRLPEILVANDRWWTLKPSLPDWLMESNASLPDLFLSASVVCASDHTRIVSVCPSCVAREMRRAKRKPQSSGSSSSSPPPDPDAMDTTQDEAVSTDPVETRNNLPDLNMSGRKALLVHSAPVIDLSMGEATVPARIPCYTRHHKEKVGFVVKFELRDGNGELVGQAESPAVMITDDHKSVNRAKRKQEAALEAKRRTEQAAPAPINPLALSFSIASSSLPNDPPPPSAYPQSTSSASPHYRFDTAPQPSFALLPPCMAPLSSAADPPPSKRQRSSITPSSPPSHFIPSQQSPISINGYQLPSYQKQPSFQTSPQGGLFGDQSCPRCTGQSLNGSSFLSATCTCRAPASSLQSPATQFPNGPVAASVPDQMRSLFGSGALASAAAPGPTSLHTSSASTTSEETGFGFPMTVALESPAFPPIVQPLATPRPLGPLANIQQQLPVINRVIPAEGPLHGGIEVTLLGNNFNESLTIQFGLNCAASVTYWSPNTLVVTLPPGSAPGIVPVVIKQVHDLGLAPSSPPATFMYTDESDRALMELALTLIGLSLHGNVENPRSIASRIVSTYSTLPSNPTTSQGGPSCGGGSPGEQKQSLQASDPVALWNSLASTAPSMEDRLLLVLSVCCSIADDSFVEGLTPIPASVRAHLANRPWLQLAARAKMDRLMAWLLVQGKVNPHNRDRAGMTALDHAVLAKWSQGAMMLLSSLAQARRDLQPSASISLGPTSTKLHKPIEAVPTSSTRATTSPLRPSSLTGLHIHARCVAFLQKPWAVLAQQLFGLIIIVMFLVSQLDPVRLQSDPSPTNEPSKGALQSLRGSAVSMRNLVIQAIPTTLPIFDDPRWAQVAAAADARDKQWREDVRGMWRDEKHSGDDEQAKIELPPFSLQGWFPLFPQD
ncbi:hypothetical protein BCR44DRAFT_63728 [Catenaria anguillulae PL171]|uniref:IPT/TIG domain-containing protein n=1 Tax=Catenaria anguillulae PL171 TaxID=765915 RepID=A0A1Y2HHV0_9FUNG|nr:hypothetical protein BCR44DRAFT_63728 [Catenaria anguillulae PL171]